VAATLTVHVLGPRLGESVILELPDGSVGVIDSFATLEDGPQPVIDFLNRRFPALSGLRFFVLTHPHADHVFRCAEVTHCYPPEELWVFQPFPVTTGMDYHYLLARHGSRDRVEAALGLRAGSVAESLVLLHRQHHAAIIRRRMRFRPLTADQPVARFCRGRVRVHYLAPGPTTQYRYGNALADGISRLATGRRLSRPANLPHNLASGAVLLEFQKTRLLLMADAEEPSWREWLRTPHNPSIFHPVHFVKTAHHGSPNGCHTPLYSALCDPIRTIAVVTFLARKC
jgi:hypothetical protein